MNRIRIIGVGNSDRGDDAAGPMTIAALRDQAACASLDVVSGEPGGLVAAWSGANAAVVVDAAKGGPVGRIHRLESDDPAIAAESAPVSSHGAGLAQALALSEAIGATPPRLAIYLVSGARFGLGDPVSVEVAAAIPALAERIRAEIAALADTGTADA